MRSLALLFLTINILPACENIVSEDIDTSSVWAGFTLTASGDGLTRVHAELKTGGASSNTYLDLTGGDALVAYQGETRQKLAEHEGFADNFWYTAAFDTDAADTEFRVAFERPEKESAEQSVVTMPKPFAISGPAGGATFDLVGDEIDLAWEGGEDDTFHLEADGPCIRYFEESIPDSGSFKLRTDAFERSEGFDDDLCEVVIKLVRRRSGTLDPAFKSGRIKAVQERTVKVKLVPPPATEG